MSALISGGVGLAKTIGLDPIKAVGNLFGNNRDEKRENRKKIRDAIHQAGVNSTFAGNTHSDDWKQLQEVAKFIENNGEPAIEYINEKFGTRHKFGSTKGGVTPSQITSGFPAWEREQEAAREQEQAAAGGSSGNGGTAAGIQGNLQWIIAGLAALVIGYLLNQ